LQLLDQHAEAGRDTWLLDGFTLDDGLVGLDAALNVVGLDGEHFLERMRRAVGFERPHFHLAEALSAELRLATERLLRDQAVGASRAGMNLVLDEVGQLEHVNHAHRNRAIKRFAGFAVVQDLFAVDRNRLALAQKNTVGVFTQRLASQVGGRGLTAYNLGPDAQGRVNRILITAVAFAQ
jgi:hypothetical protein